MRVKSKPRNNFRSEADKIAFRKFLIGSVSSLALFAAGTGALHSWIQGRNNPDNPDVQAKQTIAEIKTALNSGIVFTQGGSVKGLLNPHEDICNNVTFKSKGSNVNQVGCLAEITTVAEGKHKQWVWSDKYAPAYTTIMKKEGGVAVQARFMDDSDLNEMKKAREIQDMSWGKGNPKRDHQLAQVRKSLVSTNNNGRSPL